MAVCIYIFVLEVVVYKTAMTLGVYLISSFLIIVALVVVVVLVFVVARVTFLCDIWLLFGHTTK